MAFLHNMRFVDTDVLKGSSASYVPLPWPRDRTSPHKTADIRNPGCFGSGLDLVSKLEQDDLREGDG
ncbi:hypothetical protein [Nioella aestuarii]|uniref:hypothetical protein n=1 Tax=Nioella aestuarii TaxID=1662864 RepID=UPI003D7FA714